MPIECYLWFDLTLSMLALFHDRWLSAWRCAWGVFPFSARITFAPCRRRDPGRFFSLLAARPCLHTSDQLSKPSFSALPARSLSAHAHVFASGQLHQYCSSFFSLLRHEDNLQHKHQAIILTNNVNYLKHQPTFYIVYL